MADSDSSRPDRIIKICHLAMGDLWAGAEVQVATLLASLAKMPDLQVSAILFNGNRLANELMKVGIKTHVIPESRHNSLSIVKQLSNHFKQYQIDILHTHKYKDNILGAISSIWGGIRYRVRTVHGFQEPFSGVKAVKMKIYRLADHCVIRWWVDRILAVSFDLREELGKHFSPEKITCIHNAVDVEQVQVTKPPYELREELKLNDEDFLIGAVGRLTPIKGFEVFLKAARIIKHQRPNVKFIITGDGPLAGSLQAIACEYGLGEDVLFLGHRNEIQGILALMDLFVLPSLSEGIPMALLEALALARPVVATRVGGIPEVIEHGISGLLVPPGSEEDLAQSCIALMNNYHHAKKLGAAGRKRVEEEVSAKFMAQKVSEVYRTLVQ
jgi:glycosyltransferase involved in cell wall biosynthesis